MVYLAGPFFNEEEISVLSQVEELLARRRIEFFSPRQHEIQEEPGTQEWSRAAFLMDRQAIDECEVLLMIWKIMTFVN